MDLRQLRYFVAIVEAGGFSRAAERLHVAQSALSLHVRRMEERLGAALLVRDTRGVRPTPAGLTLLGHARQILQQIDAAERAIAQAIASPSGAVKIGVPAAAGRVLNAPLLEAGRADAPRVSIQIVEVPPAHIEDWLAAGHLDLAVRYQHSADEGAPLAIEEFYLVSGEPKPLNGRVAVDELEGYALTLPTCTYNPGGCIIVRMAEQGIVLNAQTRVDSLPTILDLVRFTGGHTILAPCAFLKEWAAGQLHAYHIAPAMRRAVTLAIAPGRGGDIAVEAVAATVRRVATALVEAGGWPQTLPERVTDAA